MGLTSIVVGIDGSEQSLRALSFSVGLAGRERAQVSACFVAHQVVTFGIVAPVDYTDHAAELEKLVNEEL